MFSHFKNPELPIKTGCLILQCICQTLATELFTDIFIGEEFQYQIPFKQRDYTKSNFDLCLLLFQLVPNMFSSEFVRYFVILIRSDPERGLTFIAKYSNHFADLENPWTIIDLLFQEDFSAFPYQYVALLAYLCKTFPEYCESRAKTALSRIRALIASTNDQNVVISCYGAMCAICSQYRGGTLPTTIKKDLKNEYIRQAAISYLLVTKLPISSHTDRSLIRTLLYLAQTEPRALLVILRFSDSVKASEVILEKSDWLTVPLPTMVDTLRLVLAILRHQTVRHSIIDAPDLVEFFVLMLDEGDLTAAILSTLFRRITLNAHFIRDLDRAGFFKRIVAAARGGPIAERAALVTFDTAMRVRYIKSAPDICRLIAHLVVGRGENCAIACEVALNLCEFEPCRTVFRAKRLDQFFDIHQHEPEFAAVAPSFLEKCPLLEEEDTDEYESHGYDYSYGSDYSY